MRNLKKILALVLALMMVLSVMVTASAASFTDADEINGKYTEAVEVLSGIGVIRGIENADGTMSFNPKGSLNRAQAATIIAYILEGSLDNIDSLVDAVETTFTDVPAWAEPYVAYSYSKGIIVGRNETTYDPYATVTGFEFGKMLLVATGACEAADFASDWKVTVSSELKTAEIWSGSDFSLKKELTREEACYLAFNALNYTPNGTATLYTVCTGTTVHYTGTDLNTALVIALANDGSSLNYTTTNTGSLADTVFNVAPVTTEDAFGRTSTTWADKTYPAYIKYAVLSNDPVLTYTTATTYGKIWSALGYTSATYDTIILNVHNNSKTSTEATVNKGDATPVGGRGTLVEVYATGYNAAGVPTYDVIVVDTYAYVMQAADITKAQAATPTTDAVPAYVTVNGMTYVTDAFKKDDVVIYTVADGKIVNMAKADAVSGYVTATNGSYGYIRVDGGAAMYPAKNNIDSAVVGTTAGYVVNSAQDYTYYLDNYGNVVYAVAGDLADVDTDYIYVIATASKAATSGAGDNLFESVAGSAAVAQAKVINLETGVIEVVDLGIVNYYGTYVYADKFGAPTNNVVGVDEDEPSYTGLCEYVELEDGSIVITGTASTQAVTVKKGTASIGLTGVYANSATVLKVVEYSANAYGQIVSASVTTSTGIANFPATATDYAAAVTTNVYGTVTEILVVKPASAAVSSVNYAVYAGAGETTLINGTAYTEAVFYAGGEQVGYYADDLSGLTPGAVYDITVSNGALVSATEVAATNTSAMTVLAIDETYILAQSAGNKVYTIYLATTGFEVYDADSYYAADTLAIGDSIYVYGATKSSTVWTGADLIIIDN